MSHSLEPPNPGPLARLAGRVVEHQLATEAALVKDLRRARWATLRAAGLMVVALAAAVGLVWFGDTAFAVLLVVVPSYLAGIGAMGMVRRMQAYRNGWLDGRRAFVSSLREATDRGLTLEEWVFAEHARDVAVLLGEPRTGRRD